MAPSQVEGGGGIGGSPAVVEGAAAAITTAATTMTTAGRSVADHGDAVVGRWTGSTADAAHQRIRHLAQRTDVGGEVVAGLPKILTDYAAELRGAQADHAAGVAAAVTARASLAQAQDAVTGAAAMDDGPDRAAAMRLSGQARAHASEAVAASSHSIDAAVAREHVANEAAAAAVRTLTALLAGFGAPTDPGASPISVRAVEAADGYSDTGAPEPAAANPEKPRTAFDVMAKAYGEGPVGIDLSDQEQADAQLDTAVNWYAGIGDEAYDAASGTAALSLLATPGGVLALPWYLSASETFKERLIDAGGADTTSKEYQLGSDALLAASIAAGLPGLGRGAAALAGRVTGRTAARAAEREAAEIAARVETDHATALTDDVARDAAASAASATERARMVSLEQAAAQQAVAGHQAVGGQPFKPSAPAVPGDPAPVAGRTTTADGVDIDSVSRFLASPETHTWLKHGGPGGEFPGIATSDDLARIAADVMKHGEVKQLRPQTWMYYKDGVAVVYDPVPTITPPDLVVPGGKPDSIDAGTIFPSRFGDDYFLKQKIQSFPAPGEMP